MSKIPLYFFFLFSFSFFLFIFLFIFFPFPLLSPYPIGLPFFSPPLSLSDRPFFPSFSLGRRPGHHPCPHLRALRWRIRGLHRRRRRCSTRAAELKLRNGRGLGTPPRSNMSAASAHRRAPLRLLSFGPAVGSARAAGRHGVRRPPPPPPPPRCCRARRLA